MPWQLSSGMLAGLLSKGLGRKTAPTCKTVLKGRGWSGDGSRTPEDGWATLQVFFFPFFFFFVIILYHITPYTVHWRESRALHVERRSSAMAHKLLAERFERQETG